MTTEEFYAEVERICNEQIIGRASNASTQAMLQNAVSNLVYQLYYSGGVLNDEAGIPIYRFEDVELDVSRIQRGLNLSVRRRPVVVDMLIGVDGSVLHSYRAEEHAYMDMGQALDRGASLYGLVRNSIPEADGLGFSLESDASLRARLLGYIRHTGTGHSSSRSAVICGVTEEEFLHTLALEVRRRFTDISPTQASVEAAVLLRELLQGEGIEFGESDYDWSASAAVDLVAAYLE